jgi:hypothetical protein
MSLCPLWLSLRRPLRHPLWCQSPRVQVCGPALRHALLCHSACCDIRFGTPALRNSLRKPALRHPALEALPSDIVLRSCCPRWHSPSGALSSDIRCGAISHDCSAHLCSLPLPLGSCVAHMCSAHSCLTQSHVPSSLVRAQLTRLPHGHGSCPTLRRSVQLSHARPTRARPYLVLHAQLACA